MSSEKKKRELFYKEITPSQKAEFINGEVIMHSPAKKGHIDASGNIYFIIKAHIEKYKLGYIAMEKAMIRLTRNDYEPDVCFFKATKSKDFKTNKTLFPAPDFIVEVLSKSTAHRDRGIKFLDYAAHGVEEYWIIDTEKEHVEQYHLQGNKYDLIGCFTKGKISCYAIDNLTFSVKAIFNERKALEIDREKTRKELREELKNEIKEKIQTGIENAKKETVLKCLEQKLAYDLIANITGLSIEEIKNLEKMI